MWWKKKKEKDELEPGLKWKRYKTNDLCIDFYDKSQLNITIDPWDEELKKEPWKAFYEWFLDTKNEYYLFKTSTLNDTMIDRMVRRDDIKTFTATIEWKEVIEEDEDGEKL
jgi:hypothetical protein